ncbi:MAG: DUF2147 domain-containing protein [Rhizomicrobium sp.]
MRNFLIAALVLAAGSSAHAQYFSFNTGGGPIEIVIPRPYGDPSGVYVHVPGYVEFGRRSAPPPSEAYYGLPRGYPQRQDYGPPPGAPPDYADDDEAPVYAPPPAAHRPIRQPRQIPAAPKKKLPKVAAIHDASPVRTAAPRNIAPAIPPAAPAVAKPLAAPPQTEAVIAPPPPVTAPAAATPLATAPLAPSISAAPAGVMPAPETPSPPASAAEAVPDRPALETSPQVATAQPVPAEPQHGSEKSAAAPPPAAANDSPTAEAIPSPAPAPSAAKPSKTVVAALPPAKQETEERAKAVPALPIGVWSSGEGQVRIQPCGKNLCGYAVGGAHAGKMVLIQMRPTRDNSWSGQVNDVRSGQNYSATMSMRGSNALTVRGCALGGLFCGSRTMSRVQ